MKNIFFILNFGAAVILSNAAFGQTKDGNKPENGKNHTLALHHNAIKNLGNFRAATMQEMNGALYQL